MQTLCYLCLNFVTMQHSAKKHFNIPTNKVHVLCYHYQIDTWLLSLLSSELSRRQTFSFSLSIRYSYNSWSTVICLLDLVKLRSSTNLGAFKGLSMKECTKWMSFFLHNLLILITFSRPIICLDLIRTIDHGHSATILPADDMDWTKRQQCAHNAQ